MFCSLAQDGEETRLNVASPAPLLGNFINFLINKLECSTVSNIFNLILCWFTLPQPQTLDYSNNTHKRQTP
jgi:hypothetical protein